MPALFPACLQLGSGEGYIVRDRGAWKKHLASWKRYGRYRAKVLRARGLHRAQGRVGDFPSSCVEDLLQQAATCGLASWRRHGCTKLRRSVDHLPHEAIRLRMAGLSGAVNTGKRRGGASRRVTGQLKRAMLVRLPPTSTSSTLTMPLYKAKHACNHDHPPPNNPHTHTSVVLSGTPTHPPNAA